MRRRLALADAPQVRVFGPEPRAFLGSAHIVAGELISTRLLSPTEVQRPCERTHRENHRMTRQIRNVAIIAHVDHGKTTLVDQLLRQSGTFRENEKVAERVMDSNDLERERGITILAKNCAVEWKGTHINIVDTRATPTSAARSSACCRWSTRCCCWSTRSKARCRRPASSPRRRWRWASAHRRGQQGRPPGARCDYVINATFELFDKLHATEEQLDFPVIFASGLNGWATLTQGETGTDMAPLFDAILQHVPAHEGSAADPLQLQICSLDYSSYVGRIGIGRVNQGTLKPMQSVAVYNGPDSQPFTARVNQVLKFEGLERKRGREAGPGDIVLVNGIENIGIGVTLTDAENPVPLPMLKVDEPTLTMNFCVNTSPLAGREGKFVTSRQIKTASTASCRATSRCASGHRRGRRLRGLRPRRTAPHHPAGEHAPRRLRAGRQQAARGVQGTWTGRSASRSSWSPPTSKTSTRAR